ncbi:hypothetical protein ACHAXS_011831, partial [Conticribra weissflogii]
TAVLSHNLPSGQRRRVIILLRQLVSVLAPSVVVFQFVEIAVLAVVVKAIDSHATAAGTAIAHSRIHLLLTRRGRDASTKGIQSVQFEGVARHGGDPVVGGTGGCHAQSRLWSTISISALLLSTFCLSVYRCTVEQSPVKSRDRSMGQFVYISFSVKSIGMIYPSRTQEEMRIVTSAM